MMGTYSSDRMSRSCQPDNSMAQGNVAAMTGRQRVRAALDGHGRPDRPARGEFRLADGLIRRLLTMESMPPSTEQTAAGERHQAAMLALGSDMIAVHPGVGECLPGSHGPAWLEEARRLAGSDLFVWAVIDGPFQGLTVDLGWEEALRVMADSRRAADLLAVQAERAGQQAAVALAAGVDGVVLGEDVAHASGLMLSPRSLERDLVPLWTRLAGLVKAVRRGTALADVGPLRGYAVFHSDGTIGSLLAMLEAAGFDGVHSLEPEAGMDAARLTEEWRGRLAFLGGLSLPLVTSGKAKTIEDAAQRLSRVAAEGGLVIGTTVGVVPDEVPIENLLRAYRAAERA